VACLDTRRACTLVGTYSTVLISDNFPLPQSPATVHPERFFDASVWSSIPECMAQTNGLVDAIVVKAGECESDYRKSSWMFIPPFFELSIQVLVDVITVLPVSVPSSLESGTATSFPTTKFLSPSLPRPIAHRTLRLPLFEQRWAPVTLSKLMFKVRRGNLGETGRSAGQRHSRWVRHRSVILCECLKASFHIGLLPLPTNSQYPSHDLILPIVKLLAHPYHSYHSHIATLSPPESTSLMYPGLIMHPRHPYFKA
jgi:hypothetical protein